MNKASNQTNLGPYPGQDRNADLQTLSFRALEAILPVEQFNLRYETQNDRGVDASLELRLDARPTNLRAQIQIKGTDNNKINQDGSVSLQVEVSNLNYLLNHPSPLYVCYIASRKELRYLWAHDECQRIESVQSNWKSQKKVSLRFVDILDAVALDNIYTRIAREGSLQRGVTEILRRSVPTDQVVIAITPDTLEHTDPNQLKDLLEKGGVASVAAGYAADVLQNLNLLNPSVVSQPFFQLLRAYAEYVCGRYNDALGATQRAMLRRAELSEGNQQFLDLLQLSCELQSGRMKPEEYAQAEAKWQKQLTGEYALGWRLGYLRHALIHADGAEARTKVLGELQGVVAQIMNDPRVSQASKLQARISILYAEGQQLLFESMAAIASSNIRSSIDVFRDPQDRLAVLTSLAEQWAMGMKNMDEAINEAIAQQRPLLIAEGLIERSMIVFGLFAHMLFLETGSSSPVPFNVSESLLESAKAGAEEAVEIYHRAECLEGEIRTKVLLAEIYYLLGRKQEAQDIATEVLPQAQIMGYTGLAAQAEGHAKGYPLLQEALDRVKEGTADDNDAYVAQLDETAMHQGANKVVASLGLPANRLPVVERDWHAMRDIARERLAWCRHINLLQDLTHTGRPETYYLIDPDRFCLCHKHNWKSLIGNPHWQIIISSFKQTYCAKCPDRSPKKETEGA